MDTLRRMADDVRTN
ncbi:hypothetical protein VTH82DRAFT_223 [Thermothelomyces myriococcoides]